MRREEGEGRNLFPLPTKAQEVETFITAPPRVLGWLSCSPQAAPPDSDGVETMPTCHFHSKREPCSIHHFYHNYFQLSSPCKSSPDRRLQATPPGIFLPIAYFHKFNVVKHTLSKLPPGEETPNSSLFFGFSSNLHRKMEEASWGASACYCGALVSLGICSFSLARDNFHVHVGMF